MRWSNVFDPSVEEPLGGRRTLDRHVEDFSHNAGREDPAESPVEDQLYEHTDSNRVWEGTITQEPREQLRDDAFQLFASEVVQPRSCTPSIPLDDGSRQTERSNTGKCDEVEQSTRYLHHAWSQ